MSDRRKAEQFGRIVGEDFLPQGFVGCPGEHQINQVAIIGHGFEMIGMGPVRTPEQAVRVAFDQGLGEGNRI